MTNPVPLTADFAKKSKQLNEEGWYFTLFHTTDEEGNPAEAKVRRLSLGDRAVVKALSGPLQERFHNIAKRNREDAKRPDETFTREKFVDNIGKQNDMNDLYVCAGFLEPRVYMSAADAEKFGGVWVGDISYTDRAAFANACETSTEEAASRFRSPRRRQTGDVLPVSDGESVSGNGDTGYGDPATGDPV